MTIHNSRFERQEGGQVSRITVAELSAKVDTLAESVAALVALQTENVGVQVEADDKPTTTSKGRGKGAAGKTRRKGSRQAGKTTDRKAAKRAAHKAKYGVECDNYFTPSAADRAGWLEVSIGEIVDYPNGSRFKIVGFTDDEGVLADKIA